jgi:hypothetical protein
MTTKDDLFLAVLAMDAYNRGEKSSLRLSLGSSQIGDATVVRQFTDTPTSFSATGYNWVKGNDQSLVV